MFTNFFAFIKASGTGISHPLLASRFFLFQSSYLNTNMKSFSKVFVKRRESKDNWMQSCRGQERVMDF